MRHLFLVGASLLYLGSVITLGAQDKPLPNVEELRHRALANYSKTAQEKERYLCREQMTDYTLDGKGQVKKTEVVERESFFVHGREIFQTLAKNGKPLTVEEERKQQEQVKKAIDTAMKEDTGKRPAGLISTGDFLRMSKLSNERRVQVAGRPTILFDAVGDENAKAATLTDKAMAAMAGTIAIDEQTGNAQDIEMRGVRDVKVGGGLVATVHKGFYLHAKIAPQPDGVWLIDRVDAAGDARVGLFVHPSMRFSQQTEGCKLSNVTADAVIKTKPDPASKN